jgi:hypothetical protein
VAAIISRQVRPGLDDSLGHDREADQREAEGAVPYLFRPRQPIGHGGGGGGDQTVTSKSSRNPSPRMLTPADDGFFFLFLTAYSPATTARPSSVNRVARFTAHTRRVLTTRSRPRDHLTAGAARLDGSFGRGPQRRRAARRRLTGWDSSWVSAQRDQPSTRGVLAPFRTASCHGWRNGHYVRPFDMRGSYAKPDRGGMWWCHERPSALPF